MVAALEAIPIPVDLLVHGTTVATNALLERTGARVVLVTTAGFEDLLWLRRQDRAALYDLGRDHPAPLVTRDCVVGVRERSGPDGVVLPLDATDVARTVTRVAALAPEAVAVALLFAFRHPAHERALAQALERALPGVPVVTSHEVLPVFREYERFSTTAAEAFLRPRVGAYVGRAGAAAARYATGALRVMTSAGGTLAPAAAARRAAALALSGPAGGVVGARLAGLAAGERDLLTLDMGGTSADAGVVLDGAVLSQAGNLVGGVPLALPAVLIESVSAGGGSLTWVDDGGALRVGPRSAGAMPGPACYGRGGDRPTVTDACVVLGWLDPGHPLAGVRLDAAAAVRAVGTLAEAVGRDAVGTAAGVVAVATAVMARALKRVSVARGVDPRGLTLVPFGGAGPLFGCALADALGMRKVLIPPHPGVLSACGLAAAAERVDRVASLHRRLAELDPAAWRTPSSRSSPTCGRSCRARASRGPRIAASRGRATRSASWPRTTTRPRCAAPSSRPIARGTATPTTPGRWKSSTCGRPPCGGASSASPCGPSPGRRERRGSGGSSSRGAP
jgi:N-methylhydantoinase A